jgi:hypothetical protein
MAVLDMLLDIVLAAHGSLLVPLRFSRPLRPFILATRKRGAKDVMKNVLSALPDEGKLIVGIGLVICLFGMIGFLLFRETDRQHFGSILDGVYAMLIIFFSAGFNEQLLDPKMASHQDWAALFFVSFLLVCNMFLLRLIVAVAFETYQSGMRQERYSVLGARKLVCMQAPIPVSTPVLRLSDTAGGTTSLHQVISSLLEVANRFPGQ